MVAIIIQGMNRLQVEWWDPPLGERLIREVGFDYLVEPYEHSEFPAGTCGIFIGRKA